MVVPDGSRCPSTGSHSAPTKLVSSIRGNIALASDGVINSVSIPSARPRAWTSRRKFMRSSLSAIITPPVRCSPQDWPETFSSSSYKDTV